MGIILIGLSCLAGYCLIRDFTNLKKPAFLLGGAFLVGCLFSGTILYLFDLLLSNSYHWLSFSILIIGELLYLVLAWRRLEWFSKLKEDFLCFCEDKWLIIFFITALVFSIWIDYHTFNTVDGNIKVVGAWSDIMYHHSFARNFAAGNAIPPEYPYFAHTSVHYHFLFDYYVAKIVQFGFNSVHAENLMSFLGLTILLLLIFEFGRSYFKNTLAGFLGPVFLMFHSSLNAFSWLSGLDWSIFSRIYNNTNIVGGTNFETWGLFNQNVFFSQRHFAFGLAILVFVVYMILKFRKDCRQNSEVKFEYKWHQIKQPLFLGLIIGALPFWHVISTGICLIMVAALSLTNINNRRFFMSMVITGLVAGLFALPQIALFKTNDPVFGRYPMFHFGYEAEPSLLGFVTYYFRVLGYKLVFIVFALLIVSRQKKWDFCIFLIPFLLGNILQFSPVLYDNNKLFFGSLIFLNCFAGFFIAWLTVKLPKIIKPVLTGVLIFLVTFGGIIDLFAYKNAAITTIPDQNSPLIAWITNNTKPNSVFLTERWIPHGNNAIIKVSLAGRYLYAVRNGTDWIGDLNRRLQIITTVFSSSQNPETVKALLKQERIDFIVVDDFVRNSQDYQFNERFFQDNFQLKYQDSEVCIYSVL